jgi:hypothetical protein
MSSDLSATDRLQLGLSATAPASLRIGKRKKAVIQNRDPWLSLLVCAGVAMSGWAIPVAAQTRPPAEQEMIDSAKSKDDRVLPQSSPAPQTNKNSTRGYVVGDGGVARSRSAPAPGENAGPAQKRNQSLSKEGTLTRAGAPRDTRERAGQRGRGQQAKLPTAPPIGVNEPGVN